MHSTRIHKVIDQMMTLFHRIGIWHGGDRPTINQIRLKWFYSIYYLFFLASFSVGAMTQESFDRRVFLTEGSIIVSIITIKVLMLIWKQKQIIRLLNRTCVFSIRRDEDFAFFNQKVEKFITFVIAFALATIIATIGCSAFPFIGNKKSLMVDIAFPLDWKNSEIGFWMAYAFFIIGNIIAFAAMAFSVIIWYLLLHCSLRYKILGAEIRNMGRAMSKLSMAEVEKQTIFHHDLLTSIKDHLYLREIIDDVDSFLSKLFLLQFATSGLCICGSIYSLAFDISDNFVERLVHVYTLFYTIAELFLITYLGNEIMLASSRLAYSLFESEWIEQQHSTKKCIIIFGEYLKQSHEVLIGKLYPLTLETFTRIINSSYSLFNILKNTKK